jgi:protein-tyrosine phosphatase
MLEVMLGSALRARGVDAHVHSAGVWEVGHPASAHSESEAADRGLDLSGHRSRVIDPGLVEGADLILALAREHVREVAGLVPAAFPRTFTVKELVRRGRSVGPRSTDQSLDEWLADVGRDRSAATYLRPDPDDDVADPIGGPRSQYARTALELESLAVALAGLLDPPPLESLSLDFGSAHPS